MIVVRVELWPKGDEKSAKEIARGHITNDETGTDLLANYEATFGPSLTAYVKDFPRRSHNVWRLIKEALCIADPTPLFLSPKDRFLRTLREESSLRGIELRSATATSGGWSIVAQRTGTNVLFKSTIDTDSEHRYEAAFVADLLLERVVEQVRRARKAMYAEAIAASRQNATQTRWLEAVSGTQDFNMLRTEELQAIQRLVWRT